MSVRVGGCSSSCRLSDLSRFAILSLKVSIPAPGCAQQCKRGQIIVGGDRMKELLSGLKNGQTYVRRVGCGRRPECGYDVLQSKLFVVVFGFDNAA
jgi:hypothetical protein